MTLGSFAMIALTIFFPMQWSATADLAASTSGSSGMARGGQGDSGVIANSTQRSQ